MRPLWDAVARLLQSTISKHASTPARCDNGPLPNRRRKGLPAILRPYSIIFKIQISSYHAIPVFIPLTSVYIYVAPPNGSRQPPRLGLLCSRHLQPSLRPCAEAFDGPTDLRRSGRGTVQEVPQQTQLLGVAVETLSGAERHTWKVVDPSILENL